MRASNKWILICLLITFIYFNAKKSPESANKIEKFSLRTGKAPTSFCTERESEIDMCTKGKMGNPESNSPKCMFWKGLFDELKEYGCGQDVTLDLFKQGIRKCKESEMIHSVTGGRETNSPTIIHPTHFYCNPRGGEKKNVPTCEPCPENIDPSNCVYNTDDYKSDEDEVGSSKSSTYAKNKCEQSIRKFNSDQGYSKPRFCPPT